VLNADSSGLALDLCFIGYIYCSVGLVMSGEKVLLPAVRGDPMYWLEIHTLL